MRTFFILLALIALPVLAHAQAPDVPPTPAPSDSSLKTDSGVTADSIPVPLPRGLGDPFNYSAGNLGNFAQENTRQVMPEIAIKGIVMSDSARMAIISVLNRTMYVREGELIRITPPNSNSIYLQVIRIAEGQIELAPQESPEKLIIIK